MQDGFTAAATDAYGQRIVLAASVPIWDNNRAEDAIKFMFDRRTMQYMRGIAAMRPVV